MFEDTKTTKRAIILLALLDIILLAIAFSPLKTAHVKVNNEGLITWQNVVNTDIQKSQLTINKIDDKTHDLTNVYFNIKYR